MLLHADGDVRNGWLPTSFTSQQGWAPLRSALLDGLCFTNNGKDRLTGGYFVSHGKNGDSLYLQCKIGDRILEPWLKSAVCNMYLWTQQWIDSAEKWHWAVQVYQLTYCQRIGVKNLLFLGELGVPEVSRYCNLADRSEAPQWGVYEYIIIVHLRSLDA